MYAQYFVSKKPDKGKLNLSQSTDNIAQQDQQNPVSLYSFYFVNLI